MAVQGDVEMPVMCKQQGLKLSVADLEVGGLAEAAAAGLRPVGCPPEHGLQRRRGLAEGGEGACAIAEPRGLGLLAGELWYSVHKPA